MSSYRGGFTSIVFPRPVFFLLSHDIHSVPSTVLCSFAYLFISAFVRRLIRFTCSFVYSFISSFVHSSICSFVHLSNRLFVHSFICPLVLSLGNSCIPFICSVIHSHAGNVHILLLELIRYIICFDFRVHYSQMNELVSDNFSNYTYYMYLL